MAIEALEGVTDQSLFDEANADEAPADVAVAEAPVAEPEQDEQPRDEAGRFAAQAAEPAPVVTDPPAPAPVDDNAAMVPSWRVREINEEKRTALAELETLRAERAQWQRPQAPQPVVPPVKVEKPDPLLDPEGYETYLEKKFEERQTNNSREFDLRLTRQSNAELFDKAYGESQRLKQSRDPAFLELAQKMQNTNAPGQVLLDWYQQRTVQAEVGNDPNAYFDKRFEAYLSDPANQAKVLERIRGGVQPQAQPGAPRQAAPVNLPPSLTRATNAAAITSADDDDVSNDGLWRHANA